MRARISTSPPLPPVKAWFPLNLTNATQNVADFKTTLCSTISAFHGLSPGTLRLSIDGFDLLDNSELSIVRDGDLICVDAVNVAARDKTVKQAIHNFVGPEGSRKRKRGTTLSSSESSESSTGSDSGTGSDSDLETSDSDSGSGSEESSRSTTPSVEKAKPLQVSVRGTALRPIAVLPKRHVVHPSAFVPPGYGKPQTRSRNLRRRLKRIHERETTTADMPQGEPVSGANAVGQYEHTSVQASVSAASQEIHTVAALPSLSLRNKNKARNFKALMGKPLPPKIIFEDQVGDTPESNVGLNTVQVLPRLIPPSSRPSLPPNMFVTSIDVEAGLGRKDKPFNGHEDQTKGSQDVSPETEPEDVDRLESIANQQWNTLAKPTREQVQPGIILGYKGLGVDPVTFTPAQVVTIARVVSHAEAVVMMPLRGVSFGGPVDGTAESCTWEEIEGGDWRVIE